MSNNGKELRKAISQRFTQLREALGLKHQQMADKLNVTRTVYTRYESGLFIPNLANLNHMAKQFNVSLDWLLTGNGEMFRPKPVKTAKPLEISGDEREMLELMHKTPTLRYKILLYFQEQKSQLNTLPDK
jgi:transcriptional regulator with XRE-family HTH domain